MKTITLTKETEAWIDDQVSAGKYHSTEEAVQEAVNLLRHEDLRQKIRDGLEELESGQGIPYTSDFGAQIKQRGRQRRARERT